MHIANNKNYKYLIFDNTIYILYFFFVLFLTINLFGGYDNYVSAFKINADNQAYYSLYTKLNSFFNNQEIDIKNNIAIPGLSFLIFITGKFFFLEFFFAYIFLMFFCYVFTLNLIRYLFNSSISYFSLILGWEFIMTSTMGGTEPVISFFLFLSIYIYSLNKTGLSYLLISLGTLVKPFMISVFAAYWIHSLLYNKFKIAILIKIFTYILLTLIGFFLLNYYDNLTLIELPVV
jgi:hypothetical protein